MFQRLKRAIDCGAGAFIFSVCTACQCLVVGIPVARAKERFAFVIPSAVFIEGRRRRMIFMM
mgnify:CR=1 FL=1